MTSRLSTALLSLLLLVPLIAGAAFAAGRDWRPADAWTADAAPQASADLVGARRAVGEASSQAGLLTTGAGQLSAGAAKLADAAPRLADGTKQAGDGSQQLYDALVELQAGTGQLGDGATKVADGVGTAVDNIVGVNAVRGQIVAAIDGTLKDLAGDNSAEAQNMKKQLEDLKAQANNFQLDDSLVSQLNEVKDGSRELANQLAVSGYAYHDGIYQVTEGAKELNAGLGTLDQGVGEAVQGASDLSAGAEKVHTMAQSNQTKLGQIQQALPAAAAASDAEDAPGRSLSPVVATLLAALVALGGVAVGARREWGIGGVAAGALGLTVAGLVGLFVLATGLTPADAALASLAFLLTACAFVALTRLHVRVFGPGWGLGLAAAGGIVQLGAVGWVWKNAAADADLTAAARAAVNLVPLNWSTTALTAVGNGVVGAVAWVSLAVLGVLAVLGIVLIGAGRGEKV